MLLEKYQAGNCEDKSVLTVISKAVSSSIELRSKRERIENFIEQVNVTTNICEDWQRFVREKKERDLSVLIADENLRDEEARRFIDNSFRDGAIKTIGTDIDKILPPMSMFNSGRAIMKQRMIEKLKLFFEKYFGLG